MTFVISLSQALDSFHEFLYFIPFFPLDSFYELLYFIPFFPYNFVDRSSSTTFFGCGYTTRKSLIISLK